VSVQHGSPGALWQQLEVLVGRWTVEASLESVVAGTATFEWALDHQVLLWRMTIPNPVPDSFSVISANSDGQSFTQHYFDARGVARIYAMSLEGDTWTLRRDQPDFTPLDFSQRFVGSIASDGNAIEGAWERAEKNSTWRKDFDLVYCRSE
jgi:hypothetical protein